MDVQTTPVYDVAFSEYINVRHLQNFCDVISTNIYKVVWTSMDDATSVTLSGRPSDVIASWDDIIVNPNENKTSQVPLH